MATAIPSTCDLLPSMKTCRKCQQDLPLDAFGKDRHKKDGLNSQCRECHRRQSADWYASNRDHVNAWRREWRANNRDHIRELDRGYYQKYREKEIAYQREYSLRNPVKRAKVKSAYRARKSTDALLVLDREIRRIKSSPCSWCGSVSGVQIDHVVPLSRGGRHSVGNLQPLCGSCNASKGGKLLVEWKYR